MTPKVLAALLAAVLLSQAASAQDVAPPPDALQGGSARRQQEEPDPSATGADAETDKARKELRRERSLHAGAPATLGEVDAKCEDERTRVREREARGAPLPVVGYLAAGAAQRCLEMRRAWIVGERLKAMEPNWKAAGRQ
jgi:hypothetical protein